MVARTLMPLTTGFLVILVDNLEGRCLARHSPTSPEHKIGDIKNKTIPTEDTSSRDEDLKAQEMVTPLTLPQDDATLDYDDQGIGYAIS